MGTRITVNGVEYKNIEEMPPEVRAEYDRAMSLLADRDGNGVPDILEGKSDVQQGTTIRPLAFGFKKVSNVVITKSSATNPEQLPPEIRKLLGDATPQPRSGQKPSTPMQQPDDGAGGITIRLSWSTMLALIAAVITTAIALAILWHH